MKPILAIIAISFWSITSQAFWIAFDTLTPERVQFSLNPGEFSNGMPVHQETIGEAEYTIESLGMDHYSVTIDWQIGMFNRSFVVYSPFSQWDVSGFDGDAVLWDFPMLTFVWGFDVGQPQVSDAGSAALLLGLGVFAMRKASK